MNEMQAVRPASAPRRGVRIRRTGLIVTFIATLALALAACGGGSSSSGGSAPSGQDPSSPGAQAGAAAFAQCVRAHGVPDFPDPQNGHFLISGADQSNPHFMSAVQTCQHLLGPNGASGGSNNSQLLTFAHCMQTHGVPQFPDPTANGGIGLPSGVDPNSPQFQKVWQECKSELPGNLQGQQP